MNKIFTIGHLSNPVAERNAKHIAELLQPSGYRLQLVEEETKDELYEKLLSEKIDLLVYPANDLPTDLPEELEIIAFSERITPHDALISLNTGLSLKNENIRIGVTSTLRQAFVKHYYPNANIQVKDTERTIEAFRKGEIEGVVMGHEEVLQTNQSGHIIEEIETSYFVPAIGQGSLAVLCHKKFNYNHKEVVQRWVNHEPTEDCIRVERSYLKAIQSETRSLPFGFCQFDGPLITLKAGIISTDGKTLFKTKKSAVLAEGKELGKKVAAEILIMANTQVPA